MSATRPNPRLQRTPLRAPLSRKPLGRFGSIVLAFTLVSCAAAHGPPSTPDSVRVVHWTTDIRPALESVICVTLVERNGVSAFQPSIAESPGCPGPLPSDPLLANVARFLGSRGVLIRARAGAPSEAFNGLPADVGHLAAAQRNYRRLVLSHPDAQRRVMPRIHRLLVAAGVTCPDCPGPNQPPKSRNISYAELIPYVLAHLWPVNVDLNGGVSMQICAGVNGIEQMKAPDRVLVDAGFDLVFGNWGAINSATQKARDAARSPECKSLDSGARVAYVRRYLSEVLPTDARFQEALRPAIQNLPEIGLACSDCP